MFLSGIWDGTDQGLDFYLVSMLLKNFNIIFCHHHIVGLVTKWSIFEGGSGVSGSTLKTVDKYSFNLFAVSWSVEVRLSLGITSFETTDFVLVLDLT